MLRTVEALHARRPIEVACSESRPALEGRRLAAHLAAAGTPVTCYGDAALGGALAGADALLLGADAVTADWFLNKCGSRILAAAALQQGVPVYVLATRDKFVSAAVAACLTIRDEDPREIWASPPPGVAVRNPYFEATPLDLVSAVITDTGAIGAALVADVCSAQHDAALATLLGTA